MKTGEFIELVRQFTAVSAEDWRKAIFDGLTAANCQAARDQHVQRAVVEDLCFSVRANLFLLHDVLLGWCIPQLDDQGKPHYVTPSGEMISAMQAIPPMDTLVEALGLNRIIRRCLRAMEVVTLEQLLKKTGIELTSHVGFGEGALRTTRGRLAVFGLRLADGIAAD